jgi:hypothetical protein
MHEDRRGRPPWADMSGSDVLDNTVRGGGIDGEWRARRNWGLAALAAGVGTIGILAYYIKKYGTESQIHPHDDELCGDLFHDLDLGTQGGNCPGSINGKSEPVFSGQVSNNIDPEEMVIGVAVVAIAAMSALWYMRSNSARSAPAY